MIKTIWLATMFLVGLAALTVLALQLPFCFEVRTLSDRLVSSAPE
jgi:hypothetical protein